MSNFWNIAIVFTFIIVLVELLAIVALARAIGILYVRLGPEPAALDTRDGLEIGEQAPIISGFDSNVHESVTIDVTKERWLLIFVSATCDICRDVIRDAGKISYPSWKVSALAVAHGSQEQNEVFRQLSPNLHLLSDLNGDTHQAYKLERTPYAFLVEDGRIRAKGIVNHRDQVEALLEQKTSDRPRAVWMPVDSGSLPSEAVGRTHPNTE